MKTAYFCVLLMIIFPYIFTVLAKSSARFDNRDPREYLQNLVGWRKRANNIQLNSFEVNPAFGIAVIISSLMNGSQSSINFLCISFVLSRIAYALCYLSDKASLRSVFWGIGMICVIGLFLVPLDIFG